MRSVFLFLIGAIFATQSFNSIAAESSGEPQFESFQVASEPAFKAAKVKIIGAKSREYASVLREFSRKSPDFAGHYIFAEFGCGASCVMSAAIDAKNGNVVWLPFTVCCSDIDKPIEFRLDSRLVKIRGSRNEVGNGTYFYVFDGRQFELVKEIVNP